MALTGNNANQRGEDEHRRKNVAGKAVILHGYNAENDEYIPVEVDAQGNQTANFATRVDDTTTASTTYIGNAPIGSATSSAVWQIYKIDESSGMVKTWADGDANYDNVWDNRASLSYN